MGVKTELEVVQSDFTRLQKEMDNRVLVGAQSTASIASTAGPSTSSVKDGMVVSIGERPRNIIGNNRPPYEQRSSGEVGAINRHVLVVCFSAAVFAGI